MGLVHNHCDPLRRFLVASKTVVFDIATNMKATHVGSWVPLMATLSQLTIMDGRFKWSSGEALAQNGLCMLVPSVVSVLDRYNRLEQPLKQAGIETIKKFCFDVIVLFSLLGLSQATGPILGSQFLAENSAVSASQMQAFEKNSYDFYRGLSCLSVLVFNVARHSIGSTYETKAKYAVGLVKGLIESVLAVGATVAFHWLVATKFEMPRPRYYLNQTNLPDDPSGTWQEINNILPLESCNKSLLQNFYSGHASLVFVAAVSALLLMNASNKFRGQNVRPSCSLAILAIVVTAVATLTAAARVVSDCHSPSAVLMGMFQGVFATVLLQQITAGVTSKIPALQEKKSDRDELVPLLR